MIPFLVEVPFDSQPEVVMAIATVWTGARVMIVYIKNDRTFGYLPTEVVRLQEEGTEAA